MRAAVLETHGEPPNVTDVKAGDWVAAHGYGGVELSAAHVADVLGTDVVVDLVDDKLDRAQELGAVEAVDAEPADATGPYGR